MPWIKIEVTIYKRLGYSSFKREFLEGDNMIKINKGAVIKLFKLLVSVFRLYNRVEGGIK